MSSYPVNVGIVGLGRWAKVLTRAAVKSDKLKIVAGYSRSQEKRSAFAQETGRAAPDMQTLLANPAIKGVILTVPNEQHLPLAEQVASAGKHVYTEKPIANTLVGRTEDRSAREEVRRQRDSRPQRAADGGHTHDQGKNRCAANSGRVAFMEANFSNERALELTPQTWRWFKDRAPGGPLSQLAIHQFDVLHYLGGEISEVTSMASKLSPVGAEVDDQSMTLMKFADGKIGYVGSCWTSPGVFAVRVFGSKGLMHYEIDFGTWDTPGQAAYDLDVIHSARQRRLCESARR